MTVYKTKQVIVRYNSSMSWGNDPEEHLVEILYVPNLGTNAAANTQHYYRFAGVTGISKFPILEEAVDPLELRPKDAAVWEVLGVVSTS